MYHPADPPLGSGLTDEDFEFIELENAGTTTIDLTGMQFTKGIDFTFPAGNLAPGQHVLVVRNQAAFEQRVRRGQAHRRPIHGPARETKARRFAWSRRRDWAYSSSSTATCGIPNTDGSRLFAGHRQPHAAPLDVGHRGELACEHQQSADRRALPTRCFSTRTSTWMAR